MGKIFIKSNCNIEQAKFVGVDVLGDPRKQRNEYITDIKLSLCADNLEITIIHFCFWHTKILIFPAFDTKMQFYITYLTCFFKNLCYNGREKFFVCYNLINLKLLFIKGVSDEKTLRSDNDGSRAQHRDLS